MSRQDLKPLDLNSDWKQLPSRATLVRLRGARELDAPPAAGYSAAVGHPRVACVATAVAGRAGREAVTGVPSTFPVDFDGFKQATIEVLEAGARGVHIDFGGCPRSTVGAERAASV